MTDRPILFSGPMVRALLAGTKTQTRRVLQAKPGQTIADCTIDAGAALGGIGRRLELPVDKLKVPFTVGDRLYVREAWHAARSHDRTPPRDIPRDADIEHAATARSYAEIGLKGKFRQGMHMPRWASRLTLLVTEVRVQRLQEIGEVDANAEGLLSVEGHGNGPGAGYKWIGTGYHGAGFDQHGGPTFHVAAADGRCSCRIGGPTPAQCAYRELWNHLNEPRGFGWDTNPWVVAVSFVVVNCNIDEVAK